AAAARPGPTFRTFAHNDIERAGERAARHLRGNPNAIVWLVSESVFSMDGDLADLPALAALRDRLGRAALLLDEAHATGILGPGGAGLDAAHGHVADVIVSTASKALGSLGGIISGPHEAIAAIHNFARSHIYSTAPPPTQAAAIGAALEVIHNEPQRRERLAALVRRVRESLREAGWDVEIQTEHPTPIIPLIVGGADEAIALAAQLREQGFFAPAIRPPTVAPNTARVRLSLHCDLSDEELGRLVEVVRR
ncbi:MAG: aminotransferase class I/II-fold pyridoxal phosphate-dependent enzyme, partial [Planctomycetota bacterium]|nr:aminotransferase class I/II-fold pyridoxal phosphate-dependent enzyme [Planctomycetota bacterium]